MGDRLANLFVADLGDGDHAFGILEYLISPQRTYPNLFDSCPPFQIDGNFGGAAGIAEMLMQSGNGEIELLPALPKAWTQWRGQRLEGQGRLEVSLDWKEEDWSPPRSNPSMGIP